MLSLAKRLENVKLSGGRKRAPRRKKRGTAAGTSVPGTTAVVTTTPAPARGGRRRARARTGRPSCTPGEGEIVLTRHELVRTIKMPAGKGEVVDYIDLVPSNLAFLKTFIAVFERIKWHKCHIYWKPAVGTTYGGLVAYAIDWDSSGNTSLNRSQVCAYTPNASHAIWQDSQRTPLVLPAAKLMSRQWYTPDVGEIVDKQPGRVMIAASGTSSNSEQVLGELWAQYTVTLAGTRPT